MAPHQRGNTGGIRGTIISTLAIIGGIIACALTLVLGGDVYCHADINHWGPVYPEAELVASDYSRVFFRPRASGITQETYYTPDPPQSVGQWYRDYRREITSGTASGDTAARGLATIDISFSQNPDGAGTFIQLLSECGYN